MSVARSARLGLRVFVGQRSASVSLSDLSDSLTALVDRAVWRKHRGCWADWRPPIDLHARRSLLDVDDLAEVATAPRLNRCAMSRVTEDTARSQASGNEERLGQRVALDLSAPPATVFAAAWRDPDTACRPACWPVRTERWCAIVLWLGRHRRR
jgi:hypothetical protein